MRKIINKKVTIFEPEIGKCIDFANSIRYTGVYPEVNERERLHNVHHAGGVIAVHQYLSKSEKVTEVTQVELPLQDDAPNFLVATAKGIHPVIVKTSHVIVAGRAAKLRDIKHMTDHHRVHEWKFGPWVRDFSRNARKRPQHGDGLLVFFTVFLYKKVGCTYRIVGYATTADIGMLVSQTLTIADDTGLMVWDDTCPYRIYEDDLLNEKTR